MTPERWKFMKKTKKHKGLKVKSRGKSPRARSRSGRVFIARPGVVSIPCELFEQAVDKLLAKKSKAP